MAKNFYANPYDIGKCGFYFDDYEELQDKLKTADFEEYEIDCIDYEHSEIFNALPVDESNLEEFLEFMEGKDEDDLIAIEYLAEYRSCTLGEVKDQYDDVRIFKGTPGECAEEYMSECFDIPKNLERYIDYEAFAHDCLCGGDWEEFGDYVITNAHGF